MRVDAVSSVDVDGDVLLFDGEDLHRLAGSAAAVFRAVDGVRTVDHIVRDLVGEFRGDPAIIANDVRTVLDELTRQHLLDLVDPAPGTVYLRPGWVAFVREEDTVALADLRTGHRYSLAGTGAQSWGLLIRFGSIEKVLLSLAADYPDVPTLRDDLVALVEHLTTAGLLVREARPA